MLKKLSTLALAGLLALPAAASAGSSDVSAQIDRLTKELEALKTQMSTMKEDQENAFDTLDEKSEAWDLSSRIKFHADFRARMDYYNANLVTAPATAFDPATGMPTAFGDDSVENDTVFTNRFRLNMRVKATENVEFKTRLAMYKVWGTNDTMNSSVALGFPSFDGNSTREARDSNLRVDRAFVNWNNIGGQPLWFSVGRRPTTDGPAAQVRMGLDQRMATPIAYMDWPFDGISVGYAYANLLGMNDAPGRVRICYGRGFENGLQDSNTSASLNDTDFAGISWDIYKKGNRFAYLQSFMVFNAFAYPQFDNAADNAAIAQMLGPNQNVGDVMHNSAIYQDKWENLTYFVAGGWSRSMPDGDTGMFNDYEELMRQGMGDPTANYSPNDDDENGYNIWIGARYDLDDLGLKFGLEYNHGSEYWIGMIPGNTK